LGRKTEKDKFRAGHEALGIITRAVTLMVGYPFKTFVFWQKSRWKLTGSYNIGEKRLFD